MGKKRARAKPMPGARSSRANDSDDELIRGDLDEDEMRDELDEFEMQRERRLLGSAPALAARPTAAGARAEVLAFDDDSGSDAAYDEAVPDIDGGDDDDGEDAEPPGDDNAGLPSDKAWGKRKGSYYSADYVDEDWKGASKEETLELAEMEEKEARIIQRRLAAQLEEDDLQFAISAVQKEPAESAADSESLPLDVSRLSKAERLDLLNRQCPELLPLVEQFRQRWTELSAVVEPVYQLMLKDGRAASAATQSYVRCKRRLLLQYCLHISFYLQLRAARVPTANHPVMRRIAQYGNLLQLVAPADQAMAPEMERLLRPPTDPAAQPVVGTASAASAAVAGSGVYSDKAEHRPLAKRLRLSKRRRVEKTATSASGADRQLEALTMEIDALEKEKKRLAAEKAAAAPTFTELRQAGQARHNPLTPFRKKDRGDARQTDGTAITTDGDVFEEGDKRSITYQMAKNKGLMPKRNKESRNPRVKHKEKFKRALKKRRSLVRLPKKELQKYGGEVFGIRMGAVKSVPIK